MSIRDLNLNCRRSAELLSEAEYRPLTWSERIGLRMHLLICGACRLYRKQFDKALSAVKRGGAEIEQAIGGVSERLSPAARERLQTAVDRAQESSEK